ncbi:ABC transporter permease, partial [Mesorhizobium sp. M7A.F.Ca.AU.001.01.1.1]|uniref:ABC transporter permease n=1 Tax=Mesorhizobium sp. M7A.F.Ca.AU.001.01.1.1 TaxID=2496675 RepID=UPI000FD3DFB1
MSDATLVRSQAEFLRGVSMRDAGTLIGLVVILAVFGALVPGFFAERNLINILQQSSINACLALGMTLVIISGGIDLSVGPTAALSAVISASMMVAGVPFPLAIAAGFAIGLACGLVNGVLVAHVGLQPFIVTLGTLSTYRALALIYTGGNPVLGLPPGFRAVFNGSLFGLPLAVVIVACVAVVAWVVLKKTPFGEYLLAVGGNEEAAYIAGVPIARTKNAAYTISGP